MSVSVGQGLAPAASLFMMIIMWICVGIITYLSISTQEKRFCKSISCFSDNTDNHLGRAFDDSALCFSRTPACVFSASDMLFTWDVHSGAHHGPHSSPPNGRNNPFGARLFQNVIAVRGLLSVLSEKQFFADVSKPLQIGHSALDGVA